MESCRVLSGFVVSDIIMPFLTLVQPPYRDRSRRIRVGRMPSDTAFFAWHHPQDEKEPDLFPLFRFLHYSLAFLNLI
jgi:hypothetical protein